jgi:hypothetical protein
MGVDPDMPNRREQIRKLILRQFSLLPAVGICSAVPAMKSSVFRGESAIDRSWSKMRR